MAGILKFEKFRKSKFKDFLKQARKRDREALKEKADEEAKKKR